MKLHQNFVEWCLIPREYKIIFPKFLQHAVPDISHCFAKFRFQNTHISQVFFSKKNPAIFLIFFVCIALDSICCSPMCCLLDTFFTAIGVILLQKQLNMLIFLVFCRLHLQKNYLTNNTLVNNRLGQVLLIQKQLGKSLDFLSRKRSAKYVCFESETSRNNAKYQERYAAKFWNNYFVFSSC